MISYNMGTASPRPVDTVATYTCNPGYTLNGGTTTRTCGSDGVWSGLDLDQTCERKWNELFNVYKFMLNDILLFQELVLIYHH